MFDWSEIGRLNNAQTWLKCPGKFIRDLKTEMPCCWLQTLWPKNRNKNGDQNVVNFEEIDEITVPSASSWLAKKWKPNQSSQPKRNWLFGWKKSRKAITDKNGEDEWTADCETDCQLTVLKSQTLKYRPSDKEFSRVWHLKWLPDIGKRKKRRNRRGGVRRRAPIAPTDVEMLLKKRILTDFEERFHLFCPGKLKRPILSAKTLFSIRKKPICWNHFRKGTFLNCALKTCSTFFHSWNQKTKWRPDANAHTREFVSPGVSKSVLNEPNMEIENYH